MDPGSSRHKRCSCFMSTHRIFYCFVLSVLLLCFPGSSLSYSPCHVSLLSSQSTAFYLVNYHFYVRPCHDATDQYILTSSPSLICHWIYLLEAVMCWGGGGTMRRSRASLSEEAPNLWRWLRASPSLYAQLDRGCEYGEELYSEQAKND